MTNWDDCEPSTSELRAPRLTDENPIRHRRRRNTKQWCRGKKGVEHATDVRVKRSIASRLAQPHKLGRDSYRTLSPRACGWSWWLWRIYDDWYYYCNHEVYCTKCGKIFPDEPPSGYCPEYLTRPKPTISPQEAEANAAALRSGLRGSRR